MEQEKVEYKNTLNLPETTLAMRANAAMREPEIQKFWEEINVYQKNIDQRDKKIRVHGLEYVVRHANWDDGLLVIDDVFDSGSSIKAIIETLRAKMRRNLPKDIRVATAWFKPKYNVTDIVPDYFIHETDRWLVFPHELEGLSREEIFANKKGMKKLFEDAGLA